MDLRTESLWHSLLFSTDNKFEDVKPSKRYVIVNYVSEEL